MSGFTNSISPVGLSLARSGHLFAFGTLVGAGVWNTFIAGPIAAKELPKSAAAALSSKIVPAYYTLSAALSLALVVTLPTLHPHDTPLRSDSLSHIGKLLDPRTIINTVSNVHNAGAQGIILAGATAAHLVNLFFIGPKTTELQATREKLERRTGVDASSSAAPSELSTIDTEFKSLASLSTFLNFGALVALAGHGYWLAEHGLSNRLR